MSPIPSVGLCVCMRACVYVCGLLLKTGYWIWMPFGMGPRMRQVHKGGDRIASQGGEILGWVCDVQLCESMWSDRTAVWGSKLGRPKSWCIRWGHIPQREGEVLRLLSSIVQMAFWSELGTEKLIRLVCWQYFHMDSVVTDSLFNVVLKIYFVTRLMLAFMRNLQNITVNSRRNRA